MTTEKIIRKILVYNGVNPIAARIVAQKATAEFNGYQALAGEVFDYLADYIPENEAKSLSFQAVRATKAYYRKKYVEIFGAKF